MAGDWIKMRVSLPDDPAVIGMAAALGMDEFSVVGRLHALWSWADVQSRDGHAHGVTAAWINRKVQRDGFAEAMVAVGWLEIGDDGVNFPNFALHNGDTAKSRALGANRKQKQRASSTGHADGHDGVSSMSRNQRDENVTREEKRREESSVPDGTGAKAPLTPDEIIFGYGVPLLTSAGTADKQARSFLGGLRKAHGDEAVIGVLRECIRAKPLQPLEWLAAALPPGGAKTKPNAQEALEASNRAVAARFLEKEAAHAGH